MYNRGAWRKDASVVEGGKPPQLRIARAILGKSIDELDEWWKTSLAEERNPESRRGKVLLSTLEIIQALLELENRALVEEARRAREAEEEVVRQAAREAEKELAGEDAEKPGEGFWEDIDEAKSLTNLRRALQMSLLRSDLPMFGRIVTDG